jgi:predicted branched-subunit amino acid permease
MIVAQYIGWILGACIGALFGYFDDRGLQAR